MGDKPQKTNYLVTVRTTLTTKMVNVDQFRIDAYYGAEASVAAKNKAQARYGIRNVEKQEIVSCVAMPGDW